MLGGKAAAGLSALIALLFLRPTECWLLCEPLKTAIYWWFLAFSGPPGRRVQKISDAPKLSGKVLEAPKLSAVTGFPGIPDARPERPRPPHQVLARRQLVH